MTLLLIVTVVSVLVALVMTVVAWRASGEERRRSEARVSALAADIYSDDLELRDDAPSAPSIAPRPQASMFRTPASAFAAPAARDEHAVAPDGLFGSAAQPAERGPRSAIVGGVAVLVGAIAVVVLMLSAGSHQAPTGQARRGDIVDTPAVENASNVEKAGASAPLELVALGHDRDGDRLTVRGIVRNPVSGGPVDRLTAVVFMFDRDGGFLGSGRATVETAALGPGGESTFVVTVPGAASVGRYRVSFRTDDRIVPHVDRRERALARS
jgi:hypothetical protein